MHRTRKLPARLPGTRLPLRTVTTIALTALLLASCGGGTGPNYIGTDIGNSGTNTPNAFVLAPPPSVTGLKISEVSSCFDYSIDCWVEVYNANSTDIALSDYELIAWSRPEAGGPATKTAISFALPAITVPSRHYALVAGYTAAAAVPAHVPTDRLAWVRDAANNIPYWDNSGTLEIVKKLNATSEDLVILGFSTLKPATSAGAWTGNGVANLVSKANTPTDRNTTKSIVRAQFTNSASDWVAVDFSTPGGQNDIGNGAGVNTTDRLPLIDKFGGLDLTTTGARPALAQVLQNNGYLGTLTTTREAALPAIVNYLPGI